MKTKNPYHHNKIKVTKILGYFEVYLGFLQTFKKFDTRIAAIQVARYDNYIITLYYRNNRTEQETQKITAYMHENNVFYNLN